LRAERHGVDGPSVGREQADRFAAFGQLKIHVQVEGVDAVAQGLAVGQTSRKPRAGMM